MQTGSASNLMRITAVLTWEACSRSGDPDHVLEMVVPLAPGAQLDIGGVACHPCPVSRRVKGVSQWSGRLVVEDEKCFLYADDDDDPIWSIIVDPLRPGGYLTLHKSLTGNGIGITSLDG
jgi:hypothetical protein